MEVWCSIITAAIVSDEQQEDANQPGFVVSSVPRTRPYKGMRKLDARRMLNHSRRFTAMRDGLADAGGKTAKLT